MCCCAIECIQCCVYFSNILLLLSGIGLLITSIVLFINGLAGSLSLLVPSLPYIYVAILLLIAAIIVICVSIYGCMVAFKGDVCALIWYYVIVVIVVCLEASALVMTFAHWRSGGYHPQVRDYITQRAQLALGKYGREGHEQFTSAWDNLQMRQQCCGVISHLDWYRYHTQFDANRPPDSCCQEFYEGCSRSISAVVFWDEGCEDYLVNETFGGLAAVGSIVIVLIIVQAILLLFVLILIFLQKFGNDPKNTCCGGSTYVKPEDST